MKRSHQIVLLFIAICLMLTVQSCKLGKYSNGEFPKKYITFGTYGGPSGEDKKVLLPNGMIFGHQIGDAKYTLLAEISRLEAKRYMNEVIEAGIKTKTFNKQSGDMSYFISYMENGQEYLWIWTKSVTGTSVGAEEIYEKLNALIPKGETAQ